MKTFLYLLTTLRNGKKDGVRVIGGILYYHDQLLMVIEAKDAEYAARVLNTKIVGSFDRSKVKCPTIYYVSDYYGGHSRPSNHSEGYFYLSLKELEPFDENKYLDLGEKKRLKIIVPQLL